MQVRASGGHKLTPWTFESLVAPTHAGNCTKRCKPSRPRLYWGHQFHPHQHKISSRILHTPKPSQSCRISLPPPCKFRGGFMSHLSPALPAPSPHLLAQPVLLPQRIPGAGVEAHGHPGSCVGLFAAPSLGRDAPSSLFNELSRTCQHPSPGSCRQQLEEVLPLTKTPTAGSGHEPMGSDLPDGQFGQMRAQNTSHRSWPGSSAPSHSSRLGSH